MRGAWIIALKDLRSDGRSREVVPAMVFFSIALVFVFSFALPPGAGRAPLPLPQAGAAAVRDIAGTILWISILFAAITGFGRNAAAEREGSRIEGLLLTPMDPAAIFVGKAMANFVFLVMVELVVIPVSVLFIDLPVSAVIPDLLPVVLMADIGMAAVGTLFAAASQYARARALILPLLLLPALLPIVLAASRLTSTALVVGDFKGEARWFILMAVFDVAFCAIGAVTFEFVIQE